MTFFGNQAAHLPFFFGASIDVIVAADACVGFLVLASSQNLLERLCAMRIALHTSSRRIYQHEQLAYGLSIRTAVVSVAELDNAFALRDARLL